MVNWLRRTGRRPERGSLAIGFLPTLDAAVLAIADARGYFADEQLSVKLVRDTSWHHLRDQLVDGRLQAAHMPGTLPLTTSLGIDYPATPLRTAFVLSLNGSSFAITADLAAQLAISKRARPAAQGRALAALVVQRAEEGLPRLRFAVTGRSSIGSYDLRHWLAEAGIDPAHDVELVAITPSRVLASLRAGRYDGAWLDEPFGTAAVNEGLMEVLFSKHAFWNNSLGKALVVTECWAQGNPRAHRALLRALLRAARWLDENRSEAAELLAQPAYLNAPAVLLNDALHGSRLRARSAEESVGFSRFTANFPWYSQPVWYLGQIIRWGDYADVLDFKKTAQAVYLPKLYREAARDLQIAYPTIGYKDEGQNSLSWRLDEASEPIDMGPDRFFDGRIYQPRETMRYINGLQISHIRAPLDAMWAIR